MDFKKYTTWNHVWSVEWNNLLLSNFPQNQFFPVSIQHLPAWPHGIAVWLPSDHGGWVRVDGSCHSWHGRVVVGRVPSSLTEYQIKKICSRFTPKYTCDSVIRNEVGSHFLWYEYIFLGHFNFVFPLMFDYYPTHFISTNKMGRHHKGDTKHYLMQEQLFNPAKINKCRVK